MVHCSLILLASLLLTSATKQFIRPTEYDAFGHTGINIPVFDESLLLTIEGKYDEMVRRY